MKDIKNTKELFEGLKLVAIAVKKIAKDKKIDISDVGILIELAKESEKLVAAFEGIKEIPEELKDLEKEELLELILSVYKAVDEIEKA